MTSGSTGRRGIAAGKQTNPIGQKEPIMTVREAHIHLAEPEILYPEDPDRCVTQDVTWSGEKVNGVATRFHSPAERTNGSWLRANVHPDDDVEISTFLTTGMIALRFGDELNVWFPKSRAIEIATAILAEAGQQLDTKDRR